MRIEPLGISENDFVVINEDSVVVASVRSLSSVSQDFLMALASVEERSIVIKETRASESLVIESITLDVAHFSRDILFEIILAMEYHARDNGFTDVILYASDVASKTIYADLGYNTIANLNSVSLNLLKKSVLVN